MEKGRDVGGRLRGRGLMLMVSLPRVDDEGDLSGDVGERDRGSVLVVADGGVLAVDVHVGVLVRFNRCLQI